MGRTGKCCKEVAMVLNIYNLAISETINITNINPIVSLYLIKLPVLSCVSDENRKTKNTFKYNEFQTDRNRHDVKSNFFMNSVFATNVLCLCQ